MLFGAINTAGSGLTVYRTWLDAVSDNIACGPRNPGTPVSITYRPAASGPGEPLVVEFLEKK